MTRQEAFDKVVAHARGMKRKSQRDKPRDGNVCLYRGPHGNKCFVGALFPDERYTDELEGEAPDSLVEYGIVDMSYVDTGFLCDLQNVHDRAPLNEWEEGLREVGVKYRLGLSSLDGWQQS